MKLFWKKLYIEQEWYTYKKRIINNNNEEKIIADFKTLQKNHDIGVKLLLYLSIACVISKKNNNYYKRRWWTFHTISENCASASLAYLYNFCQTWWKTRKIFLFLSFTQSFTHSLSISPLNLLYEIFLYLSPPISHSSSNC